MRCWRAKVRMLRYGESIIMIPLRTMLVAVCFGATASLPPLDGSPKFDDIVARSDAVSSAQRQDQHRRNVAPAQQPVPYRGFADPSFGPDGKPYPVPEYLRGQCYVDLGYGR